MMHTMEYNSDEEYDSEVMTDSELKRRRTEQAKTLSGMTQSIEKTENNVVNKLIKVDLENAATISTKVFLDALVGNVPDCREKYEGIAKDPGLDALCKAYEESLQLRVETQRYEPFCKMANYILNRLHGENRSSIIFARNDPQRIFGNYRSAQVPDVVVVRNTEVDGALGHSVPCRKEASIYQEIKDENGLRLTWLDVLSVFEFRSAQQSDCNVPGTGSDIQGPSGDSSKLGKRKAEESDSLLSTSKKKKESFEEYRIKMARYSAHQLSTVLHRRHIISILILGKQLIVAYYDHGGAVQSEELEFLHDRISLIALIDALHHLDIHALGFVQAFRLANREETSAYEADLLRPGQQRRTPRKPTLGPQLLPASEGAPEEPLPPLVIELEGLRIGQSVKVFVRGPIVRRVPFGLIGRGSSVHEASILGANDEEPKGPLALKASWQLSRRKPEWEIIGKARDELSKVTDAEKYVGSLPKIYLRGVVDELLHENLFRKRAGITEAFQEDCDRKLHVVVFEMLEQQLCFVQEEVTFRSCFRDIFKAHFWVHETAGILHRDISVNNLMVRLDPDGKRHGVLIDWDLASATISDDEQNHTGTRTGTRAFMAAELFDSDVVKHILRHDWESFLYYLMWVAFVMIREDDKEKQISELRAQGKKDYVDLGSRMAEWPNKNNVDLSATKRDLLQAWGRNLYKGSICRFQSTVTAWIDPIWDLFVQGNCERFRPGVDFATLGVLSYESLCAILDSAE